MAPKIAQPWRWLPAYRPNVKVSENAHQQDGEHLEPVGQRRGALERMGGVGVEEAAAVVAHLLDPLLGRDRADGDGLLRALERGHGRRRVPRLRHALPDQDQRADDADRQQDVEDAAGQVHPVVAERLAAAPHQAADQRDGHGQAGRRRREVADGQHGGLDQVAGAGLARVVLPVGVGLEADRRVERQVRRLGRRVAGVERQHVLEPQHDVAGHDGDDRQGQHGDRVRLPRLLDRLVDAGDAVDGALDRAEDRAQEGALALHDLVDVGAEQGRDHQDRRAQRDEREEIADGHAQKSSGRSSAQTR